METGKHMLICVKTGDPLYNNVCEHWGHVNNGGVARSVAELRTYDRKVAGWIPGRSGGSISSREGMHFQKESVKNVLTTRFKCARATPRPPMHTHT